MIDYKKLASNDLRSYIWAGLQNSGVLDINNYYADGFTDPLVPILPAQEVPEFNNLLPGRPFMTYDYEVKPVLQNWWIQEELLILTVTSVDSDEVNSIMAVLQDLFKRYDLAATAINAYLGANSIFHFHYTAIEAVLSPQAFKTEGGNVQGEVHIMYKYSRKEDNPSNGPF